MISIRIQDIDINDIDVVLSADEKYLAIRYDGIITVYPL